MKTFLTFSFLFFTFFLQLKAQIKTEVKYYSKNFKKEVPKEKALYSETKTTESDGTVTKETIDLKANKLLSRTAFKGEEPVGVWISAWGNSTTTTDYSFELVYRDTACSAPLVKDINKVFEDNDTIGYTAPVISGGHVDINNFLMENIQYPQNAADNNIQGECIISFTLEADGTTSNVFVKKRSHVLLDKEAARVIRLLKFSKPAAIKGKSVSMCLSMPIRFVLVDN